MLENPIGEHMSAFQAVGLFLVSLLFTIILFTLWLRIAIRFFKLSAVNPVSQVVYKVTNPILLPLHRVFKVSYKPGNPYDWMAFILIVFVEFLKIAMLSLLAFGTLMPISIFLVYVLSDLVIQPLQFLFYFIIIEVILSWVNPTLHHPVLSIIKTINRPFLQFGRYIIPDISGFDFSPFVVLILLKVITLFIRFSLPWPLI